MKLSSEVSEAKLRGGFYSSQQLVDICLTKIRALIGDRSELRVLEPSAGDGAFIRGIAQHPLAGQVAILDGVELLEGEAAVARDSLEEHGFNGSIIADSFLSANVGHLTGYDVAVGNPPYLRFQFMDSNDFAGVREVEGRVGSTIGRVSNLWIPIFLSALLRLKEGGAFSFILPSEFLTGVSARLVREWLTLNTAALQIEIFPPKSFPGVLQEVIIVSGRVVSAGDAGRTVQVTDHVIERVHIHNLDSTLATWTAFTIAPGDLDALRLARSLSVVRELKEVAQIGVSTVTGANDYFTYADPTLVRYELEDWSRPLLSRSRQVPGFEFTREDWDAGRSRGEVAWLLDTGMPPGEVELNEGLRAYIQQGEARDIHTRYKTRIRSPWYKVPVVRPKTLLLSKRSHYFPRLIANAAGALTTDTIYQGELRPGYEGAERQFVGGFHNSLTLLTAEIEGRSFGGGVLELVPSEIRRLQVIDPTVLSDELSRIDSLARHYGYESDSLIEVTNEAVSSSVAELDSDILAALEHARQQLLARRLSRN
ncbi:SAM-dependent methyltransferase [Diaminobutyricimonas sp. TR449]|uniref:Eco57I restriction-modification methylase domain-containing protein n=1 Tax=Diaminobutyricimonas sp. TR449 TaxID=2708076 RepID=UPI00141F5DF1|nr:SAM-dependent methyltransferase [Diaminobutyricimonas sp. TR449]